MYYVQLHLTLSIRYYFLQHSACADVAKNEARNPTTTEIKYHSHYQPINISASSCLPWASADSAARKLTLCCFKGQGQLDHVAHEHYSGIKYSRFASKKAIIKFGTFFATVDTPNRWRIGKCSKETSILIQGSFW